MDDVAHVGLVHAHAEGVGGDHHGRLAEHEATLDGGPRLRRHAGVVGLSPHAARAQIIGHLLHVATRAHVDDAALPGPLRDVSSQPLPPLGDARQRHDREAQVGAVERRHHLPRIAGDAEPFEDVASHLRVRRGREREGARVAQLLAQAAQHEVVGAEVVPPVRDAMRLVDRQQPYAGAAQPGDQPLVAQPLGREVEQRHAALDEVEVAGVAVGARHVGVDEGGADAGGVQALHLVLHERDQRRDDERTPDIERRQHVAEALATAGGHDRQHIAPGPAP